MNQKVLKPSTVEKTAQEMRRFVQTAQRKLLEFEAQMSMQEIKEGKAEIFTDVDDVLKSVK